MKTFTVNTKTEYEKDGEIKTLWHRIGRIVIFDEGAPKLELFMHPDTKFFTFEDKPKEDGDMPTPF